MKNILKRLLKPSNTEPFSHHRGFTSLPLAPWKRNLFAVLGGTAVGLFIGQYFPDVFWSQV